MNEPLVVVLAGGVGSRFWPVSTPAQPKQLLPLGSERPLIADTVERAERVAGRHRLKVLTGERIGRAIQGATDLEPSAFLIEPEARGTCPVLTWAAHEASRSGPETVVISLHADHVIEPEDAFVSLLQDAARVAHESDLLLTVAVPPTRAETGYGYIDPGEVVMKSGSAECLRVRSFIEKPDMDEAQAFLDAGYLWNSGIFIWRADRFLAEVREHEPGVAKALPLLDSGDIEGFFAACPNVTVDDAVLARSSRVGTVRATFRWDDVGSWEALTRTRDSDEQDNVALGDVHAVESRDNVAVAVDGSVVLFGVTDLVVVQKGALTFVTTREKSPSLKDLLKRLPERLVALDGTDEDEDG